MKLSVTSIDKYLLRVEAEGEITMRDFHAEGPDPFDTLLGAGWASHKVVLDFRRVNFVDSSAIGWLMTCRREFERNGGLFLVHSIQPRVRQVLDLLRVGKALPLLADERAALAAAEAWMGKVPAAPAPVAPASLPFAPPAPSAPKQPSLTAPTAPVEAFPVVGLPDLAPVGPAPKPRPRKRKAA
jgi:anti-anti-sigma factor